MKIIITFFMLTTGAWLLFFAASIFSTGPRTIGALENIKGVPMAREKNVYIVSEKLMHVDVYLVEPVLAKQLKIQINFTPLEMERLAIGVRDNPFWLSYNKYIFYQKEEGRDHELPQQAQVIIPLTDKIQDNDKSIDLMFFAEHGEDSGREYDGIDDNTKWLINDMRVSVERVLPNAEQLKDYTKSLIGGERVI